MSASPAPIVVRVATLTDIGPAGRVVADAYLSDLRVSDSYVERLRDSECRAAEAVLFVAVDALADVVVGSITYVGGATSMARLARADEAELRMLGVSPTARGRGVAKALVLACIDRSRAEGRTRVVLSTQVEMRAAHRLYDRLGFVRRPELDWVPEPSVVLVGYALTL